MPDLVHLYRETRDLVSKNKPVFAPLYMLPHYSFSKLLLHRYVYFLSQRKEVLAQGLQVYSCSPGWVRTEMGGSEAPLSVEQGVQTPLHVLGISAKVHPQLQGQFFFNKKVFNYL